MKHTRTQQPIRRWPNTALVTRRCGMLALIAALVAALALTGNVLPTVSQASQPPVSHAKPVSHVKTAHSRAGHTQSIRLLTVRRTTPQALTVMAHNWSWYVQHAHLQTVRGTVVSVHATQHVVALLGTQGRLISLLLPRSVTLTNVHVGTRLSGQARIWENIGIAASVRILSLAAASPSLYPAVGQARVSAVGVVINVTAKQLILSPGPVTINLTRQTRILAALHVGTAVRVTTLTSGAMLVATVVEAAALPVPVVAVPVPMAPVTIPQSGVTSPGSVSSSPPLPGVTYGGRAYGASLFGTLVADTGQLPANGGNLLGFSGVFNLSGPGYSFIAPTVPGAAAMARVIGGGTSVTSSASVLNFRLNIGGVLITGDTVQAQASSSCPGGLSGQILTTGLEVNGTPVAASYTNGAANQTFALPNNVGTITFDEQISSGVSITVNALHIHTTSGQDIILASAQASISGCVSGTATVGATSTATAPLTATTTPVATNTPTPTGTLGVSGEGTGTATAIPSSTSTPTPVRPTSTGTMTPTPTGTLGVSGEGTGTATALPTSTGVTGGGGQATATATVTATATATSTATPTGYLQICKEAQGPLSGYFSFTVAGQTVVVPVGACSANIQVPAGTVTVTEQTRAGVALIGIAAAPANRLVSSDLSAGTATVQIVAGGSSRQTIVIFTNSASIGLLKICKVAGPGVTVGTHVSISDGTKTVSVPAGPAPGGFCVIDQTFPVGTQVTLQETIPSGNQVAAIAATPALLLVNSDLTTGTAAVTIGTGVTEVTFVNQATTTSAGS